MALSHDDAVRKTREYLHSGMALPRIRLELQLAGLAEDRIDDVIANAKAIRASSVAGAGVKQLLIGVVLLGLGLASWLSHRGVTIGGRGHDRLGSWAVDIGLIAVGAVFTGRGVLDLLASRHDT